MNVRDTHEMRTLSFALLRRPLLSCQIARRVDQHHVGKGLRKISELAARIRLVLLGEQPKIVAQSQQALEELSSLSAPPLELVVVSEPEVQARNTPSPGGRPSTFSFV